MTQTQKENAILCITGGAAILAFLFVIGLFNAMDDAIENQAYKNRMSVYCQQYGAIETLCNKTRKE